MDNKTYTPKHIKEALRSAGFSLSSSVNYMVKLENEGIIPKPRFGRVYKNIHSRIYNREEFEEVVFKLIEFKTRNTVSKADIGKLLIRVGERMVKDGK